MNEAYSHCFGVDLVELGTMKIGSQLDAYTAVQWTEFHADIVEANIALLPKKRSPANPKRKCLDGKTAKTDKAPARYKPNGGVKHCYIPEVERWKMKLASCISIALSARRFITAVVITSLKIGLTLKLLVRASQESDFGITLPINS